MLLMLQWFMESEPPHVFSSASTNTGFGRGWGFLREEVVQGGVAGLWVAAGGKKRSFWVHWVVTMVQEWMTSGSWVGVRVRKDQATISLSVASIETYAEKRWERVSGKIHIFPFNIGKGGSLLPLRHSPFRRAFTWFFIHWRLWPSPEGFTFICNSV